MTEPSKPGGEVPRRPDRAKMSHAARISIHDFPARPRLSLAVATLGFFVVALDAQIVNIALPAIRHELGGGLAGQQWVVTGYTLMFSALQLFSGTVSDRFGARRAYGIGMVLFVLASVLCTIAPTLPVLVAGRVVQGVGAAVITPTSLALIREAVHDVVQRGRAIAYWALGGSVAAAAGPVVGGALTQLDWRLIFLVNLPVGGAACVALSRIDASPRRTSPFDPAGQIAAVAALGGLTYGIIEGAALGYSDPQVLGAFAVFILSAAVFLIAQTRGRHPTIPPGLFAASPVRLSILTAFVTMAAFYGVVFLQSLYFQQQRGASALVTGLLFLPMSGLVALFNPFMARAMERFGKVLTAVAGQLIMALGLLGLSLLPADAPTFAEALLMVPVGVGGSFTSPPLAALVMDHVPAGLAGTASGVLNTARQLGGTIGVAAIGAVLGSRFDFTSGLRAVAAMGILLLALAAVSLRLRKTEWVI